MLFSSQLIEAIGRGDAPVLEMSAEVEAQIIDLADKDRPELGQ